MDPVPIIEATLAPVFLISGGAIFLNFLQSRLFRVNDRIRAIDRDTDREHRRVLARRARLLRNAILLQVLVIASIVATALLLIVAEASANRDDFGNAVLLTFAASLLFFAASLAITVQDTFLSVRHVERDTR